MSVTVTGVNDAPTVAVALANQNASEDSAFSFTVPAASFTDADIKSLLPVLPTP